MSETVLDVTDLRTKIDTPRGIVHAVDGVSLELRKGECFALVGESGSGKSMTALSLMRLLPEAGRIVDGRVLLDGQDLLALPEAAMRSVRGRRVAMIFQEPATALNPARQRLRAAHAFEQLELLRVAPTDLQPDTRGVAGHVTRLAERL